MFFAGALCALAAIKRFEDSVMYDEIVKSVGARNLLNEARRSGNMRHSGLDKWYRKHKDEVRAQ
jgi:hypothetical protein